MMIYVDTRTHKMSQHDLAIASDSKALTINSDSAKAHFNLGGTYYRQGKRDAAIAEWQKAIDINPNLARAHYNLACAYSLKNEKILSIKSLRKVIALDKSTIEAAKTDSDFENIRESPEFQQLINSVE